MSFEKWKNKYEAIYILIVSFGLKKKDHMSRIQKYLLSIPSGIQ